MCFTASLPTKNNYENLNPGGKDLLWLLYQSLTAFSRGVNYPMLQYEQLSEVEDVAQNF